MGNIQPTVAPDAKPRTAKPKTTNQAGAFDEAFNEPNDYSRYDEMPPPHQLFERNSGLKDIQETPQGATTDARRVSAPPASSEKSKTKKSSTSSKSSNSEKPPKEKNNSKKADRTQSLQPQSSAAQQVDAVPRSNMKTTHTIARDHGVVQATPSTDLLAEYGPDDETMLSSAIRWPIPKPSRRKGDKERKVPNSVQVITSNDGYLKKTELSKSQDDFVGILNLPEGTHRYQFIVDGQITHNPEDPVDIDGRSKQVYNILKIEKNDFDIFNALDFDQRPTPRSSSTTHARGSNGSSNNQQNFDDLEREVLDNMDDGYTSEIPTKESLKVGGRGDKRHSTAVLPPHLLQKILLNEQVHASYEPSLLPEPNHVMLNHLYALAIRNQVMALSATSRYKKKFVTTLLYKPC